MENFQKLEIGFIVLILIFILVLFFQANGSTGFSVFGDGLNSPYNFIDDNNLKFSDNSLIISISNYTLVRFEGTGSMLPTLSETSTGIGIIPKSAGDIHVGDIINFESEQGIIIHRVVEIGEDEYGVFFVTKGDNSNTRDEKIRFEDVRSILVGILY